MFGDDETYNNTHRAFLQAFLARGTLTLEDAKPVLAAIFSAHEKRERLTEDITEADFNTYVSAANTAISTYDYEIRSIPDQNTRKRVYALVNTTSDPVTQMSTLHTADEISYLKRVLDAMFETYNTTRHEVMAITSMQAIRLHKTPEGNRRETQNGAATQGSSGQGLTMMQAETMLNGLVDQGWFEKSRKGYYSLAPRALMELRQWLVETYNELADEEDEDAQSVFRVKTCFACKDIITSGQRCPQRSCLCRLHDICIQNFFRAQKSETCPVCKAVWTGNDFVGERAAASTDKQRKAKRNGPTTQRAASLSEDENGVEEHGVTNGINGIGSTQDRNEEVEDE